MKKLKIFLSVLIMLSVSGGIAYAVVQTFNNSGEPDQTFVNGGHVTVTTNTGAGTHTFGWSGLLPVSRGGTGIGSLTTGSILFFGTSSVSQDNTNLFWDNTNKRLGIGTSSPTQALDISGSAKATEIISNKLSATGTNQSLSLNPTGTGEVVVGGDSIVLASKSSAPTSPRMGQIYFDTTLGNFRGYNGSQWLTLGKRPAIEVLVIAGGGGGGAGNGNDATGNYPDGGGGGGGGYKYDAAFAVTASAYSVTVGNGGTGGVSVQGEGGNGDNSSFSNLLVAIGGGGGAGNDSGLSGGSGGGGSNANSGGTGTAGQGNAGGSGAADNAGGGGGGASAVGANASGSTGGNGGVGIANSISGSSVTYAGGGGGGTSGGTAGSGGAGGGGSGGSSGNGSVGQTNRGGGGGGGGTSGSGADGGAGGSGVVIIVYKTGELSATGGTEDTLTRPGYTIHTFTSGGTFTITSI